MWINFWKSTDQQRKNTYVSDILSWTQRKFWKINKSTENLIIYILTLNAHKHVKVKKYYTIESSETVETENESFNKSTRNLLLYCPSVASKWVNFWKSTDQQRKTLIYLIFELISEKILENQQINGVSYITIWYKTELKTKIQQGKWSYNKINRIVNYLLFFENQQINR